MAPGLAFAQGPRIQYDPNSPAGAEYALPLDQARSEGAGATGQSGDTKLFGSGISKPATGAPGAGSTGSDSSSAARGTERSDGAAKPITAVPAAPARGALASVNSAGASGLLVTLGTGLLVLMAGLALALALRHRTRASSG